MNKQTEKLEKYEIEGKKVNRKKEEKTIWLLLHINTLHFECDF